MSRYMKLWLCFDNIQLCLTTVYRYIELKISLRAQSASGETEPLVTPCVIFETAGSFFLIGGHSRVANIPYWQGGGGGGGSGGGGSYSKISTR